LNLLRTHTSDKYAVGEVFHEEDDDPEDSDEEEEDPKLQKKRESVRINIDNEDASPDQSN